ncbi:PadR family transcriptional regulator [Bacillus sp. HMF5848]|uniref:PadR family transcriptional regulator n=1 Tax=Bacillus sp. HMF5848 TaxID=2495421 RepID=UPI000F78E4B0|nr:PadR family transcriptional regulator [Bacillus sp. HMF5848]RSK29001.1 PadR family transcriptional regulator [Bacillus sp. HMF5848]
MTRLMVLGLLRMKPMSGYEIQQILQQSQTDLWAGILPGSIYHALKKMEKEELVEIATVEKTGNRIKAIYQITENGEEEFLTLLKESLQQSSVCLPSNLYTGLGFIQDLVGEEIVELLSVQINTLQADLEKQKAGIEAKRVAMGKLDEVTELTAENLFAQYKLQIEFLKKLTELYTK